MSHVTAAEVAAARSWPFPSEASVAELRGALVGAAKQAMSPQARQVFEHMLKAGSITAVEAHAVHRIRSVSRRITEIVRAIPGTGYSIRKEHKRDVTDQRYVRYWLVAK